jgi:hypothetical protein
MARPSTTASIAAFHTGVFDTIGFLTAWSSGLRQSLLRTRFVDPFGRRSLPGRKNSLKALLPRAPETVPPQSAPAEPETTKKLDCDGHGKARARWSVEAVGRA